MLLNCVIVDYFILFCRDYYLLLFLLFFFSFCFIFLLVLLSNFKFCLIWCCICCFISYLCYCIHHQFMSLCIPRVCVCLCSSIWLVSSGCTTSLTYARSSDQRPFVVSILLASAKFLHLYFGMYLISPPKT